jgi:dTDP-4-amino-4,6-dideoxygalactose transaminase
VVTVSHSFIATANAVRYCGATPVFVDIDAATFNLDPSLLEAAITGRTRAILCVHQIGMPCDLRAIIEIAAQHHLPVVEDAACAMGSEIMWDGQWERIGKPHGDIACFSFHPRKVVTTGDGGMITTARAEWDQRFRSLRQHAMSVPDTVRHAAREVIVETYDSVGYNYRMTDIQAAVGREQLKRLPDMIAQRRYLAANYVLMLSDMDALTLPHEPVWTRSNWQSYCVRLPEGLDQRRIMQAMLDEGIATKPGVMCVHRERAYAHVPLRFPLPQSEWAQDECLLLPLYVGLLPEEQERVAGTLRACVEGTLEHARPASRASLRGSEPT